MSWIVQVEGRRIDWVVVAAEQAAQKDCLLAVEAELQTLAGMTIQTDFLLVEAVQSWKVVAVAEVARRAILLVAEAVRREILLLVAVHRFAGVRQRGWFVLQVCFLPVAILQY